MSQSNDPFEVEPGRSQPRYQPPTVSGSDKAANSSAWPPAPGSGEPPNPGQGVWGSYQSSNNAPASGYPPPANYQAPPGYGYSPNYGYPPNANSYTYGSPPVGMPAPFDPQAEAYKRAAKRVKAKLDFYKSLTSYVIVNAICWGIALITLPRGVSFFAYWPIWMTVFWGIGLASQWWSAFGMSEQRHQDMIEEEMRRMNRPRS